MKMKGCVAQIGKEPEEVTRLPSGKGQQMRIELDHQAWPKPTKAFGGAAQDERLRPLAVDLDEVQPMKTSGAAIDVHGGRMHRYRSRPPRIGQERGQQSSAPGVGSRGRREGRP